MATLFDKYDSSDDVGGTINVAAGYWRAQTWLATQSYTCTRIDVKVYRVGSPGTVTVSLYNTSSGDPLASQASGTFDGDAITASTAGEWVTVTLNVGVQIVDGTTYAVVLNDASSSTGNYIAWRRDNGAGYAGGMDKWTGDSGATWNDQATDDFMFRIYGDQYPTDKFYSKSLLAISNDEIWYESVAGTMSILSDADGDLNTAVPLTAVEAYQKLFIANGVNKKVLDFVNTKITTDNIGSHPPDFHTVLTGADSGAVMIVDYITTLTGACVIYGKKTTGTFADEEIVTGTDDDNNDISFELSAAETAPPHWYDWTSFGNSATYGALPSKVYDVKLHLGRLCLSRDPDYPHQWYKSRQGNPWDWLYMVNDVQSPVAGNDTDAGEIGDIVVAQIPYSDDYMVHGCASSIWYEVGDICQGGSILNLTESEGLLTPQSYCWDVNKNLYLLTTGGLVRIPPGFGGMEYLTSEKYPNFMSELAYNPTLHRVVLAYDPENDGIHIFRTLLADGTNANWWWDLNTNGLFYDVFPTACGVFSAFNYQAANPDYRKLLLGCNDGYIRWSDPTAKSDNIGATDEAIDSFVVFGPIPLAERPRHDGRMGPLEAVTAGGGTDGSESDSNDLAYTMYAENSAEKVIESVEAGTSKASGTITAPGYQRGNRQRKRARGKYGVIKVGNSTLAQTWGFEKLTVDIRDAGRTR